MILGLSGLVCYFIIVEERLASLVRLFYVGEAAFGGCRLSIMLRSTNLHLNLYFVFTKAMVGHAHLSTHCWSRPLFSFLRLLSRSWAHGTRRGTSIFSNESPPFGRVFFQTRLSLDPLHHCLLS